MKRSETANREGGTMAEEKKPFVRRDGDELTFNLKGLREAADTGLSVGAVILEDIETAAKRALDYGRGVLDRAEERLKTVACPGCGTTMEKDAEGPGYTCPQCHSAYTPRQTE